MFDFTRDGAEGGHLNGRIWMVWAESGVPSALRCCGICLAMSCTLVKKAPKSGVGNEQILGINHENIPL